LSHEHVQKKIHICLEQEITTFDQADIYGDYSAEGILGETLRKDKSLRNQMEIITKCDIVAPCGKFKNEPLKYYDTSQAHLNRSVNASLKDMAIEHIDLLLLHRPDPLMNADETGEALDELIKSGKVRSVGVSNFKPWDWSLLQSRMSNKLLSNQIEFSLLNPQALNNGDLSFHYRDQTPVMAWSPLGGGDLLNKNGQLLDCLNTIAKRYKVDVASVAIAWVLKHPAKILPILGTNNLDRISKISESVAINMDRTTWFELYTASIGHEVP
jgi:predicted oxidoreductase